MNIYTNTGLVNHAKAALALKTKYMWGGILRPVTAAYINQLTEMYKNSGGTGYTAARIAELNAAAGKGYYGVDCVGLVKSYYWSGKAGGGTGSPNYGRAGFPDVNANAMFAAAKVKGAVRDIPETPGLVVYSKTYPHVGVYIGGGKIIESTLSGRGDGVIQTKLSDWKGWEYWFECPFIEYSEGARTTESTVLKAGDTVRVKEGAKAYNDKPLASFVFKNTYTVMEIGKSNTNRIVIGAGGKITAAVRAEDLIKQ